VPRSPHGWRSIVVILLAALGSVVVAASGPRFLIFHIDAVAAVDFDGALAVGCLPNVERAFADGFSLRALTLFPASTPVIYPRLHTCGANDGPGLIGFGGYDRDAGCKVAELDGFLAMVATLPRRAVTNLLHGVPGLDGLAAVAMRNLPDLLERYRVVEFFWFSTDAYGHLEGRDAHLCSLERFDAALGEVWPSLDTEGLNLILYADHGMSFEVDAVDEDPILRERVGGRLLHAKYPNLYLHDPADAAAVAYDLSRPGGLDYAFFRAGPGAVHGYVDGAFVRLEAVGPGIRYLADGDPLGYAPLGYAGEALTPDEWLDLTFDTRYPAAPANVFRYLQHPDVGDLVAGFNLPRIPWTPRVQEGNHAGFADTDLVVRVWARGPDVAPLAGRDPIWLQTLYRDLPALTFGELPERERHTLEVWLGSDERTPGALWRLSPAYRWRLAAEAVPDQLQLWSEHDLLSTYLTRWWVGGGMAFDGGTPQPFARAEVEIDVGDLRLALVGSAGPEGWAVGWRASLRLTEGLRLAWSSTCGPGFAVEW